MKQLKIIGLTAKDYRTLEAVELTPDVLSNSLIRIVGEHGAGKSSTIDLFKIPLTGLSGNNTKENIGNGFSSELLLSNGENKIYLGVKIEPFKKGENKGKPNETWYVYTKDTEGNIKGLLVDGKEATASSFSKLLSTSLTFDIPSLFSKNATEHRKVIEGMFSKELHDLGANEVVAAIIKAKENRDAKRNLCGAVGAFMETFEAEGWKKESLGLLTHKDIELLQGELTSLEVEKGGIITSAGTKTELNKSEAQKARDGELRKIKDDAAKISGKMRDLSDSIMGEYRKSLATYEEKNTAICTALKSRDDIFTELRQAEFLKESLDDVMGLIFKAYDAYVDKIGLSKQAPIEPAVVTFDEDGIPVIPDNISPEFKPLVKRRSELLSEYADLKNKELIYEIINPEDTSKIDNKIATKKKEIEAARLNNSLYNRFQKWLDWMEACGLYDSLIDDLRKLYGRVNTGVEGLSIYPVESAGGVNIWLKYTGVEDKEFFRNDTLEPRFLWDYSATQQGVIGVMLQGSLLDKNETPLRLAIIDEMPLTALGVKVMTSVTEKYNVQLITSYAANVPLDDIEKGVIVIENGRAFFSGSEAVKAVEENMAKGAVKESNNG